MGDFYEIDFLGVETKKSGDAIALRYEKDGHSFIHVIDGGYSSTGEVLRDHIVKMYGNPSYLDNVISTHNDSDHANGLVHILEHFDVGTLWMLRPWLYAQELLPRFSTYTSVDHLRSALRSAYPNLAALEDIAVRKKITIREPFQGSMIGHFTVMTPTRNRYLELILTSTKTPKAAGETHDVGLIANLFEKVKSAASYIVAAWGFEAFPASNTGNENEMSIVQYAHLNNDRILLTADTGRDGLQEVIDYAPFVGLQLPGVDRFQVPHHGGRHNVTSELLDQIIGPRFATQPTNAHFHAYISSALADEDHPRKVVVRAVMHRGGNVFATEGKSIRSSSAGAPPRYGWSAITPASYPTEYEG